MTAKSTNAHTIGQGEFPISRELGHSEGRSSYATAEDDTSNAENNYGILTNLPRSPHAAHSRGSAVASDTTSFQRRDFELRSMDQTLTDAASRKSSLATQSRFKEDLGATSAPTPVRTSIVSKLQSSFSRLSRIGSGSFGPPSHKDAASEEIGLKSEGCAARTDATATPGEVLRTTGRAPCNNSATDLQLNVGDALRGDRRGGDLGRTLFSDRSLQSQQGESLCVAEKVREEHDVAAGVVAQKAAADRDLDGAIWTPPAAWIQHRKATARASCGDLVIQPRQLAPRGLGPQSKIDEPDAEKKGVVVTSAGTNFRHIPQRLERAVKSGLDKLLHVKEESASGIATSDSGNSQRPPRKLDALQIPSEGFITAKQCLERGALRDKCRTKAPIVKPQNPYTAKDTKRTPMETGFPSVRTSKSDQRCTEQTTVTETSGWTPVNAAREQERDVFVTPMSRLLFDSPQAGLVTTPANGTGQQTIRRWKSADEPGGGPRVSPPRSIRSAIHHSHE